MMGFFIHDKTRGYVGNSMVWWRRNHHGYTCDINEAHAFTEEEAIKRVSEADDLVAYPMDEVMGIAEPHVTQHHKLKGKELGPWQDYRDSGELCSQCRRPPFRFFECNGTIHFDCKCGENWEREL